MAKRSNSSMQIISLTLMIIGIGLAFWGYQLSDSVGSQISQTITGAHSDKVMMLFIGGAASFIVGLYLFVKK